MIFHNFHAQIHRFCQIFDNDFKLFMILFWFRSDADDDPDANAEITGGDTFDAEGTLKRTTDKEDRQSISSGGSQKGSRLPTPQSAQSKNNSREGARKSVNTPSSQSDSRATTPQSTMVTDTSKRASTTGRRASLSKIDLPSEMRPENQQDEEEVTAATLPIFDVDVDAKHVLDQTALHEAVACGDVELVHFFIFTFSFFMIFMSFVLLKLSLWCPNFRKNSFT